ncbi:MAG: helix-turn-helix domain-containing protein [Anaerolineae bacterium]
MNNDILVPALLVMPGEVLRNELEARGISQSDLALIIDRPEQMISEIINGKKQITAETANDLAHALTGIPAEFWLRLEVNYQLHLVQRQEQEQAKARRAQLLLLDPIRYMIKKRWLEIPRNPLEFETAITDYLGINPLKQQPTLAAKFRYSTMKEPDQLALWVWVKRVESLVEQSAMAPLNIRALANCVENGELLHYAQQEQDIAKVEPILAACGVHLAVVPHLDKTYLDGSACLFDGRGSIALTLRYDRIDSFWFTLLHEVAHLLENSNNCYLDTMNPIEKNTGIDGSRAVAYEELRANQCARNWLIPPQELADFIEEVGPNFDLTAIERFAASIGRHPGIVVGRLMRDGNLRYNQFRELLVKVERYIITND